MFRPHREFLEYLEENQLEVREIIKNLPSDNHLKGELEKVYNDCVRHFHTFRSIHMNLVKEYIINQQGGSPSSPDFKLKTKKSEEKEEKEEEKSQKDDDLSDGRFSPLGRKLSSSSGGKGTGGTNLEEFLEPIRENVKRNVIMKSSK